MADSKQWGDNSWPDRDQKLKEFNEKNGPKKTGEDIENTASIVFIVFFVFVGIAIVISCVAACVRYSVIARGANRIHGAPMMGGGMMTGQPMMGGGMMMGQPMMGGGMMMGQPGAVMYQQTNCKLIHVKKTDLKFT